MDIRCECSRKPLLARVEHDDRTGAPFLHIRHVKGDRLIAEVSVLTGKARVTCRECLRELTIDLQSFRSK